MDISEIPNEELIKMVVAGEADDRVWLQLQKNFRPMMCKIGFKYLAKLPLYDEDDIIQEGMIVMWKLTTKKDLIFDSRFNNLFYTAFDFKCKKIYRDYVLRNLIVTNEWKDSEYDGYHVVSYGVADYAVEYRRKKSIYNKKRREQQNAANPNYVKKEPKPKMTEEEKRQKRREYYLKNKEHFRELKKKWYQEHREYAIMYSKCYKMGVRLRDNK